MCWYIQIKTYMSEIDHICRCIYKHKMKRFLPVRRESRNWFGEERETEEEQKTLKTQN